MTLEQLEQLRKDIAFEAEYFENYLSKDFSDVQKRVLKELDWAIRWKKSFMEADKD